MSKKGCTCQQCSLIYKVDLNVPDEIWERINDGHDMLCGMCIIKNYEELNEYGYLNAKRISFPNNVDTIKAARNFPPHFTKLSSKILWRDGFSAGTKWMKEQIIHLR